jgi:hypothetical protein
MSKNASTPLLVATPRDVTPLSNCTRNHKPITIQAGHSVQKAMNANETIPFTRTPGKKRK